jgi:Tol biopolymer transport system component
MLIFNSWHTAGRSDIYTVEDDGSHLHCLTSHYKMQRYQRLGISPRHDLLMFYAHSPRQEAFRFFFWELGTDNLNVYEQEPYPYDMRWLTNDRLLCTRKEKRWITDLEHPRFTDLDFLDEYLLMMAVAPDGNRLLLKKGPGTGGNIYVGDIGQRQVHEIFHAEDKEANSSILYPSSWSPDGTLIACVGGFEDEIWLINANGSDPRKFASGDFYWMELQWSPDSRQIAYTRSLDGKGPGAELAGVFIKDLQGGEEKQVLQLGRGGVWRWTRDGQGIVYTQGSDDGVSLLSVNIRTGSVTGLIGSAAGIKDIAELVVV